MAEGRVCARTGGECLFLGSAADHCDHDLVSRGEWVRNEREERLSFPSEARTREAWLGPLEDGEDLYGPIEDRHLSDYVALVERGFVVGGYESSVPPLARQRWFDALCARAAVDDLVVRTEVVWNGYGGMAATLPDEDVRCGLVRLLLPDGADPIDPAMPPIIALRGWRTARTPPPPAAAA